MGQGAQIATSVSLRPVREGCLTRRRPRRGRNPAEDSKTPEGTASGPGTNPTSEQAPGRDRCKHQSVHRSFRGPFGQDLRYVAGRWHE